MSKMAMVTITRTLETDLYFRVPDDCGAEGAAKMVQKKIEAECFDFDGYEWENVFGDTVDSRAFFGETDTHDAEWDFTQPWHKVDPPTMGEPEEKHWITARGKRWVTDGYVLIAEGEERHSRMIYGQWYDDISSDDLESVLAMDGPYSPAVYVGTTDKTAESSAPSGVLFERSDGEIVCVNAEYLQSMDGLTAAQGPGVLDMVRLYRDGEMVRGVMPIRGDFEKPVSS